MKAKCVPSNPEFDVIVEKNVMVEMRDGVRLATDVYRPSKNGKVIEEKIPTILQRTPYNKELVDGFSLLSDWFCKRGYNVAIQDFRGRFKSEGTFYKYANMGEDGYDTIEWIAKQEWSNGKIGTIGTSFLAHAQVALACMNPPHLSTMIINQGGFSNAFLNACRHNGAFEIRQLTWAFARGADSKEAQANPLIQKALEAVNPVDYLNPNLGHIKEGQTALRFIPEYERFYFDFLTKAEYNDFWKKVGLCAENFYDVMSDVPTLIIGGWYDSYTRAMSDIYRGLSRVKKGPIKFIMGPWVHGWQSLDDSRVGDVDMGPNSKIKGTGLGENANRVALRWFDHWLKGIDTGIDSMSPVQLFVMGGGDGLRNNGGRLNHGGMWRAEGEWPPARAEYTRYYLHEDGTLNKKIPDVEETFTAYSFDPLKPVPTIGGNISAAYGTMNSGAFNQVEMPGVLGCEPPYVPLSSRNDVLVFQTPPLSKDVETTGPIQATLWVSSSACDTDFTVKLIDVYPPNRDYLEGYAMNISDTIFRARFHKSWEKQELLTSGEIYKLDITSYPTSNLFKKGHKIRVDISSSNYPRFDINPNSGEPLGRSRMTIIAHQKVYHDREHPSSILLPIITK